MWCAERARAEPTGLLWIVLVDGTRLAALMIEHGVGVQHRELKVPGLDGDYFEEA